MSAIRSSDAPIETMTSSDDGVDAFLDLWKVDAEEPSADENDEEDSETEVETDDTDDTDADEQEESDESEDDAEVEPDDEDDDTEETDEKPKKVLKDDSVVKIKVGDEELAVPVEKLKRLYGQEAALTRKSQEVAATRKQLEENGARHVAASEKLLAKAQERFEPFKGIDWLVAAQELSADELKHLRGEAQKAYNDVKFLETELDTFMETTRKERHEALVAESQKTIAELSDPKTGIKGFNAELVGEMRNFALASGVPAEVMDQMVSAPIWRVLHKAMLFDKGQKVALKKVDKSPKKIIKSKGAPQSTTQALKGNKQSKAMTRLKTEGSVDAAADAFLASFVDD